jgi:hypothetical protein
MQVATRDLDAPHPQAGTGVIAKPSRFAWRLA